MDRIRVLIADDEPHIRETLATVVRSDPSMELVGTAPDAETAIELAEVRRPDIALLDVRMPGGGPKAAREIARRSPPTRVVALSAHEDRTSVVTMIRAGAKGYLGKDATNEQILGAIRDTADGAAALGPAAMHEVYRAFADAVAAAGPDPQERRRRERIRRIIRRRAVDVVYQPVVDLRTSRAAGAEAFARFRTHPMRPPDRWFAEAQAAGLRLELELVALDVALEGLDRLAGELYLGVNVAPETVMSQAFLDRVGDLQGGRLVVELSERATALGHDALPAAISELRARGVRVALDDAWARYSSLSHILRLGPDVIKLDMSVTRGLGDDPTRRALVAAILSLAPEIGASVVAKGVETARELQALRELEVAFAQGYLLGRPGAIPEDGDWGVAALDHVTAGARA